MAARQLGVAAPGFRLPAGTHVGGVKLQVADLERSLHFYTRVLGLREASVTGDSTTLAPQGADRILVELHERTGARPVPPGGTMGLFHFAILLPDRASLGRFLIHLGTTGALIGMADHAVSEALYLTDPDGLGIEVYADRPRSSWQIREHGELYMTTKPLDVQTVMASANGEKWYGMPAGTVMGHVHLHVADLENAAAFYHAALGFDKVVWTYPGALFLSAGGYHHHLGTNTWSSGPPAAADQARLLSWDLIVPRSGDADDAARSLESAGYPVARSMPRGFTAVDPWGTTVRIVEENRHATS